MIGFIGDAFVACVKSAICLALIAVAYGFGLGIYLGSTQADIDFSDALVRSSLALGICFLPLAVVFFLRRPGGVVPN